MVAHFLGLKLRILANTFKRSPWQLVALIVGLLYGIGVCVVAVLGLIALRLADVETARNVVVIGGSLAVLGFLVVPLVVGVEDTLDPRRFSLFGMSTDTLALGLAVAAFVGVPSLVIASVAMSTVATWSRGVGPAALAVVGALLVTLTCVLGARVTTSVAALTLATRRARDTTGIVALVALVLISPAVSLLANVDWGRDTRVAFSTLATTLGWTPLGAAWSAPADAAAGDYGAAFLKLLLAAAFVGVLVLGWRALVARMLVTPERESHVKVYGGLGLFDRFAATPTGAIAARSLTYWLRDPRYRATLVMIPILPVLLFIPLSIAGAPAEALWLMPLPFMCLFLGWSIHNDVAYDSTALWLHVASGTRGTADRVGRIVPVALVGIPLVLVGAMVSANFHGDDDVLPSLIGVSSAILFAGIGLSSVMSARFPYPAVQPGDSPFKQPQSSGAVAALLQSVSFLVSLLIASPAIVFAGMELVYGGDWGLWSLASGVAIAVLSVVVGVAWGGRIFERRGPELLAFATRN
ncbi:ABC transporter permease [Planctomonas deserti]|uniref:ABC transporter permease n=1 Tax=Planctomonas deserti TaxID=2144185 RepID=UPI000D38A2D6|nr:ABC transporter permease [Planctomonas deserti]